MRNRDVIYDGSVKMVRNDHAPDRNEIRQLGMSLKIGFIGCGLIAQSHAIRLGAVDTADIVIVFDIDSDRAASFAEKVGAKVATSVEQVIDEADGVYVTTWTSEHPHLVSAIAAAGKAIFCEKPLGVDLPTARTMFDEVQAAGVVNQVGLVLRHSPAFRWMHHQMSSGVHGPRMSLVFRDDQYIPVQGMYGSTWRGDLEKAGAGTLLEHSIHDLDLIEWIFGPIVRVSCVTSNTHGIEGIEDQASVLLTASHGGQAILSSTWHDVVTRPSLRLVEGFCQGTYVGLEGDWIGPIRQSTAEQKQTEWQGQEVVEMAHEIDGGGVNPDADFVAAVLGERRAFPDFGIAVRAHVLADAAYRSAAQNGAPVEV
jgi:predicted dehydrogenase